LYRDRLSQRWGASFSLRRLGAAFHGAPALWGPAQTSRSGERKFLPVSPVARAICAHRSIEEHRTAACGEADGLRALAQSNLNHRATLDQSKFKHCSIDDQIRIRSKSKLMPLIEIPPQGKDVSMTVHLPEETANDVKLYARFLKATHQSAPSAIINECIRRTLKQDSEFQTWKSDPTNTKTNRGGARPRKTVPTTPPQGGKPEAGAKIV
jgi:hypothetical protein